MFYIIDIGFVKLFINIRVFFMDDMFVMNYKKG